MRKPVKPAAAAIAIILAVCAVADRSNPEHRIKRFVHHNGGELTAIAEARLSSDAEESAFRGVKSERVFRGGHDIVQFECGGTGIVPEAGYYGFYYSPDDAPAAYQNANCGLFPVSGGAWEWSDGRDNGGRTSRIAKNWFYYEAWF